jgi:uncharacterized OB-fold protein
LCEIIVIESIGTYLPVWGTVGARVAGDDEDVITLAVAAGSLAIGAGGPASPVTKVVLVSREVPLLEGGNSAALLAGLDLSSSTEVHEELGGAPAVFDAVVTSPPGTLVIGSDLAGGAGAAAVLVGSSGSDIRLLGRVTRSLPVVARDARGSVHDYRDPRLLRERGFSESLAQLGLDGPVDVVAGLAGKDAATLVGRSVPTLPTRGASAALFALAASADGAGPRVVAVEQATVSAVEMSGSGVVVVRDEPRPAEPLRLRKGTEADISVSLAAYERAFDAKLRFEASRCDECGTLAYPRRYRCINCGSEKPPSPAPLPRDAEVYSLATIHLPVPGLNTPYSVVLVDVGDTGVRMLGRLTGAPPGSVAIGDRGRMVFRRVAVRTGVPDYGYAFLPESKEVAA